MNSTRRLTLTLTLTLMAAWLGACGGEASEATQPAPSTTEEAAEPEAAAAEANAEPTPANEVAAEAAPAALPVPVPPGSWQATMGELTVDGVTVRFVSASCGAFAMMPVIQAVAASTASCENRADTQLAATFVAGRLAAINTSGPDAACVRAGVMQATTNVTCQFQFTFGN